MIKKFYLFSLVLLSLAFVSCEETKEVSRYDNWQARNESFIDSLANVYATAPNNGGLKRFELTTAPGEYMYYKVEKATIEPNAGSPKYTDWVKVHYKGTNILDEVFDGTFVGKDPMENDSDTGIGDSTPVNFQVNALIAGWKEALQRMKKGDRWKIYIPWKQGYGSEDQSRILAYSTLIFDLTLLDYADVEDKLKN